MGKVLKVVALTALVVGATILTMNPAAGAAIASALGTSAAVGSAIATAAGGLLTTIGTAGLAKNLAKSPSSTLPDLDRLNLTSVAAAPRKMVFGTTALATDLRYIEPSGDDQEYVDCIVHVASHRITSVMELRIEDKVAWTAAGGAQGEFAGYLTISAILEGGAAAYHTINGGSHWGAAQRLTGCASLMMRIKRSGNSKKTQSPFAAGVPTRMSIVGEGMPVYDPRRDSTRGGSGSHRAADQTTWQFADGGNDIGNNPALQCLAYLLGWRINGIVSVGCGMAHDDIDFAAFAAAANVCDEPVALATGGSQRRYAGAGLFADNTDPLAVLDAFASTVNGWMDDSSGRIGLFCAVNDLAGALVILTDDDILSPIAWAPFPEISEQYNIVRGLNPDPAMPANFQPTDYPEVKISAPDGVDRALPLNFAMVDDKRRAQRLAKQVLQRQQFRGLAQMTVGLRGWQLAKGQPIRLTSMAMGWHEKLFRVESWQLDPASADVNLTMREENAGIYAWDAEEAAAVVPATPITYNPLNNPFLVSQGADIGVENGATVGAPNGTVVGSMPVEQARLGPDTDLYETFSAYADLSDFDRVWDRGAFSKLTFVNDNASPGGRHLLAGDNSGSDAISLVGRRLIPYDAEDIYCIEWDLEFVEGGTGALYLGVRACDASGNNVTGNGTYHYVAALALDHTAVGAARRVFRGYFRGYGTTGVSTDPANPTPISVTSVRVAPIALLHYSGGIGRVKLHSCRLFKLADFTPIYSAWDGARTYRANEGAIYDGRAFVSRVDDNLNQQPPSTNVSDTFWLLTGARGTDGAPGLSIAATRPVMMVSLFANGFPKPGELPQTTQMIVYDGDTNVTSAANYSVTAVNNCSAAPAGGGAITMTAVSALPAWFDVEASYGGRVIQMRISVAAPKDGASASRNSASAGAPSSTGSLVAIGSVDLVVADGASVLASGAVEYRAVDNGLGTRTITLAAACSIENLTDAGAPTFGSESTGSQAVYIHLDGDSEAGYVAADAGMTNSTGAPKTFRAKLYTRKSSGNSTARTIAGDYASAVDISAA